MKTSTIISAAAAAFFFLLPSCETWQREPEPRPAWPAEQPDTSARTAIDSPPDSTLLVCALSFPGDYDWSADTLFGHSPCTLRTYRGAKELLCLPAGQEHGIGTAHGQHHFLGGKLWSEYSDLSGTVLSVDGIPRLQWPEKEHVLGIMLRGSDTLTLSSGSKGLSYRKNGQSLLSVKDASAFGGFGCMGYGPNGALYEDSGAVCFCYAVCKNGLYDVYSARDGATQLEQEGSGNRFQDVRVCGGKALMLYTSGGVTIDSRTGVLWGRDSALRLTECAYTPGGAVLGMNAEGYAFGTIPNLSFSSPAPDWLCLDGEDVVPLYLGPNEKSTCYFPGGECVFPLGSSLALALSPRASTAHPYTLWNGFKTEYPVHGFITAISF